MLVDLPELLRLCSGLLTGALEALRRSPIVGSQGCVEGPGCKLSTEAEGECLWSCNRRLPSDMYVHGRGGTCCAWDRLLVVPWRLFPIGGCSWQPAATC